MQQISSNQSITPQPTIVSETSLQAVLNDIRNGESGEGFFDGRYDHDSDQDVEQQEPGREVKP